MLTSDATRPLCRANYGLPSVGELKTYSLLHKFLSSKVDSLTWAFRGPCVCWRLRCDCYCEKFRRDSALVRPLHYTKPVTGYTNSKSQVIYDTSHISFLRTQFSATLMVRILRTNSWQSASVCVCVCVCVRVQVRSSEKQSNTAPVRLDKATMNKFALWLRCVET